jgi:hypothetical protein
MKTPALIGTPKQVKWAEELRSEYLARFEADVALVGARQDERNANRLKAPDGTPIPFPTMEDLREFLSGAVHARTWIDGRPNYCGVVDELWTHMAREAQSKFTRQERRLLKARRESLRKFGRVAHELYSSADITRSNCSKPDVFWR